MRFLIVEDDYAARKILQYHLSAFGTCDFAGNGREAIEAFETAWKESRPYTLICMDIMMPVLDGQSALHEIRRLEIESGVSQDDAVKVIMITALDQKRDVVKAFYKGGASAYFVKPIQKEQLIQELVSLGLIDAGTRRESRCRAG
jgi:two-component system chemotaxis response regulator CheY